MEGEGMDIIKKELGVPAKYIREKDGRICLTVNRHWITNFMTAGPISFISHDKLTEDEIAAQPSNDILGPDWLKIYAKVYKKKHKAAIPLPRGRHNIGTKSQTELSFTQLLHYVSETNYKNLWKEVHKKYYNSWNSVEQREQFTVSANANDITIIHEVITRMYSCPIIQVKDGATVSISHNTKNESHCNLLPVLFAIETNSAFIIFHEQTAKYSLRECVTYSPAALNTSHGKPLFLIYQLLRLSRDLHDLGLVLGEINLSDILLMDNFTIQILPKLSDNIYLKPESELINLDSKEINKDAFKKYDPVKKFLIKGPDFGKNKSIERLCEMWVQNYISNYDYLTALNNLAGRKFGDPSCHHVMPWVTDFMSRCGGNWRDLTKSKFRLNKGDRQLDLTYNSQSVEVGHHVSDVLSEITYYVYLSRRYDKSVLCKHVRPLWVPGEYPASIQRLHEWSPDECIPQFFTDPSVFKSIHEDLPDLEVPAWATSPEDFIEKHREALEGLYVSERLHHWIDLTFGYKLSGSAAIKSKNVCLQLVDNHTNLMGSGVVQLFTQPHPQKIVPSPYWNKVAPRLKASLINNRTKSENLGGKISDDDEHSSDFEEEELSVPASSASRSSPLALSRLLSRSRGSLLSTEDNKTDKSNSQTITLPKDYNPVASLIQVETMHTFINKVTHQVYKPVTVSHDQLTNYKQIVACSRIKEQQILGCLIVEIFLSSKFRATWNTETISFAQRLNTCLSTLRLNLDSLPKCVRNAVVLLLQIDAIPKSFNLDNSDIYDSPFRYPTVTFMGLPPPSAHQFLQPILSGSLFPSSKYCQYLFNVAEMLQEYNSLTREVNVVLPDEDDEPSKTKIKFLCKISECKVKAFAREIDKLLPRIDFTREPIVQLIIPHIKQIMDEPFSAVLAAWHLFDPVARILGPKEAANTFLVPIMRLYENGSVMDNLICTDILSIRTIAKFKTMRLYHRSFLLKLMVRLGLRRFLENFITPLVEAVGGYRDYIQGSTCAKNHRTGNLKNCDLSTVSANGEGILSPLDEDSSADSEHVSSSSGPIVVDYRHAPTDNEVEEVFIMESEENNWSSLAINTPYNLDLQIDLNLNLNEDITEENTSPLGVIKSPTIPIPKNSNSGSKSIIEFSSIGCHVGSKTSSEGIPFTEGSVNINPNSNTSDLSAEIEENVSQARTENPEIIQEEPNQMDNYRRSAANECTVSEMSAESIIWLSHRLGPVLTARHLSRNLFRMLTLCYVGKENLTVADEELKHDLGWNKIILWGDSNAVKVLECLTAIAGLYGEQIILLQYFANLAELLSLCKRKLTQNLEGGLISCLALFNHVTTCLSDATLMDALVESIIKSILHPTIRILATTRFNFPNGVVARMALAEKYLEAIFMLSLRLGSVVTKNQLAVPIQRFFLIFDKVFNFHNAEETTEDVKSEKDKTTEISGTQINSEIADSYSPPMVDRIDLSSQKNKAYEELQAVFTAEFAHKAYMLFYRNISNEAMDYVLKNHRHVRELCKKSEQELKIVYPVVADGANFSSFEYDSKECMEVGDKLSSSFGNIAVVGNRFEIPKGDSKSQNSEIVGLAKREAVFSNYAGRQLRGNWLAYWEHEIGRPDKDTALNIKQIKLQSFLGHTNSVRCMCVLDNENSFISGSRDKTVKLWSLRSQGDGSTASSCQYTYTGHKKSILALTFLESLRYAVTCDGVIHYWDPFMGSLLGTSENSRSAPVNTLTASPSHYTTLLVATTDITLRVIDCRTFQHVNEMKVSANPSGLIRCIAIAPSGHWIALGQASGFLTVLDIRTGLVIASWKGHECEILQLEAVNDTTVISSSLDQTIAAWSAIDGKLKFHMKGATEPVHCMAPYEQELIIGTTANRIGVYTAVDSTASFSSSKLRSDAFKGVLTTMEILPLNRLLLLGADNGGITLLC
ncbi:WD repeat-containing protein 81 isoform X2 [Prorops nasuta]|uniref:WD repeat-containing protein 81 isoform X2 n=1 Tax=Prorops nasuta TaxID=863751 RepID=UPI0034CEC76F